MDEIEQVMNSYGLKTFRRQEINWNVLEQIATGTELSKQEKEEALLKKFSEELFTMENSKSPLRTMEIVDRKKFIEKFGYKDVLQELPQGIISLLGFHYKTEHDRIRSRTLNFRSLKMSHRISKKEMDDLLKQFDPAYAMKRRFSAEENLDTNIIKEQINKKIQQINQKVIIRDVSKTDFIKELFKAALKVKEHQLQLLKEEASEFV